MEVTLGGERLGTGEKAKVQLYEYNRSTFDLSSRWRNTQSAGTLVPFMKLVGLTGDIFDIDLNAHVMTPPTVGPLYGSYKVQLDVFLCPIRNYHSELLINATDVGRRMQTVKLPIIEMTAVPPSAEEIIESSQINPSCIFSYLGIKGLGHAIEGEQGGVTRTFNGLPLIMYWDITKNYYTNKQEEVGAVIAADIGGGTGTITSVTFVTYGNEYDIPEGGLNPTITVPVDNNTYLRVFVTGSITERVVESLYIMNGEVRRSASVVFQTYEIDETNNWILFKNINEPNDNAPITLTGYEQIVNYTVYDTTPNVRFFPLTKLDALRMDILRHDNANGAFVLNEQSREPISYLFREYSPSQNVTIYSKQVNQEGLALKTYQADIYNTWLNSEWIDGQGGVNEMSAISTASGQITIDEINLASKIYNMLNRIMMSGGTYENWMDVTYTDQRRKSPSIPLYMGGLSKELTFDEQVSTAATDGEPLGSIAGIGRMTAKHKGGSIKIRVEEPSYIMGIISITPRLTYSQGNDWDMSLTNMDDFHKPALDAIGFQDLIADEMAWWSTGITSAGVVSKTAIGKQPAWINYMTAVDQNYGNFALPNQQMWMVLDRRYTPRFGVDYPTDIALSDATTYINPSQFNHIFADTRLDAMNFWVQVQKDITVRRLMSSKVMPNL